MAEAVSKQEWGRAFLRIQDAFPVQEHAAGSGIDAFYLANKTTTMSAIARAVEGHPDVRMGGVEENFLLVPVFFYSQLGYRYFTSILKGRYLQECLQNELEQLEYKGLIIGCGERWELPNLPEGEVESWELVSMGTRGIIEDKVMSWLDVTHDISDKEDVEEEAGPPKAKKARLHQQPPVQEGPLKRLRAKMYVPSDTASVADAWDILGCSPVRAGDDSYSSAMPWKTAPPVATVSPSPRPNNTPEPIQEYEAEDDDKERNSQKNSEEQSNEGYGIVEWE